MLRLPIKHLHRAFPELDSYSDEQCLRFVRASRGSTRSERLTRALVHFIIIAIINILCFAGAATLLFWIVGKYAPRMPAFGTGPRLSIGDAIATLLVLIALVSVGPILGYLARDFLVIDRIRWILRSRGLCSTCRYSLVGLAVSADNRVTCPECATTAEVDASLGELTMDEAGRPRFRPDMAEHVKAPLIARTPQWMTRFFKRLAWACAALIVLALLIGLGAEFFLRVQATNARRSRPTQQQFEELVQAGQEPGTSADEPDFDDLAVDLRFRILHAEMAVIASSPHTALAGSTDSIYYGLIGAEEQFLSRFNQDRAITNAMVAVATKCIETMERDRVFEIASEMARRRRPAYVVPEPEPGTARWESWRSRSGQFYSMSWLLQARGHLAIASADSVRLAHTVDTLLGLARLQALQPGFFGRLASQRSRGLADMLVVKASIAGVIDGSCADAILASYDEHAYRPPLMWSIEFDILVALDAASWLFEDASAIRLGPWFTKVEDLKSEFAGWGGIAGARVGTYAENVRAIRQYRQSMEPVFTAHPTLAPAQSAALGFAPSLLVPRLFCYSHENLLVSELESILMERGVRLMLQLERYRSAHGTYPDVLSQLESDAVGVLPRDLWSDTALCYRRIDPAADPHGRHYIVYSTGADGVDDTGATYAPISRQNQLLWTPVVVGASGFDYIINEPSPNQR